MQYRKLGRTGLEVSAVALGTMTFGEDNTELEAFDQLDLAFEAGVTLFDTAELYPVPPRRRTSGASERILGSWLASRNVRDRIVLASKVVGPLEPGEGTHIRRGEPRLDKKNIEEAVDASLRRLQTDTIDLYQLHWPERSTNFFKRLNYVHDPNEQPIPIEETLEALDGLRRAGKVRHFGVSNETPWGVMKFLRIAEERGWPRMASIQNPYNLLNRTFEIGLAEVAHREDIGLLAYSPTAFGTLSGKYLDDPQARGKVTAMPEYFFRYSGKNAALATRAYVGLAREAGLDPAQMALAFIHRQPFVTSTIVGATTCEQLRRNIGSLDITLPADVVKRIEEIHAKHQNVCP